MPVKTTLSNIERLRENDPVRILMQEMQEDRKTAAEERTALMQMIAGMQGKNDFVELALKNLQEKADFIESLKSILREFRVNVDTPKVDVTLPPVTIDAPQLKMDAPQVNVTLPPIAIPETQVVVQQPARRRLTVERDTTGKIKSIEIEEILG